MPTNLALFVLFAIGSAKLDCHESASSTTPCTDSSFFIGACPSAGTSCVINNSKCTGLKQGQPCWEGNLKGLCAADGGKCKYTEKACTEDVGKGCKDDANLLGTCTSDGGNKCRVENDGECAKTSATSCKVGSDNKGGMCAGDYGACKHLDSVKIEYQVRADTNAVAAKMVDANFTTEVGGHSGFSRSTESPVVNCLTGTQPVAPNDGNLNSCSSSPGGMCHLTCPTANHVGHTHTLACVAKQVSGGGTKGEWEGAVGTCEKACKIDQANAEYDQATHTLKIPITGGKIVCPDVVDKAECSLSCATGKRVATPTAYTCEVGTHAWDGATGACGDSVEINGTVIVDLKVIDDHEKISSENDATFNAAFIKAVVAHLGGNINKHNISIDDITIVTSEGERRLSERSAQVEYTVQVGKDDDDGRRLVEEAASALRGIRLGEHRT